MSDVMKAIRELDKLSDEFDTKIKANHFDRDLVDKYRERAAKHHPILRDHIGELHSAIARLKGEHKTNVISPAAFEDLFALLPTDWAGDEG